MLVTRFFTGRWHSYCCPTAIEQSKRRLLKFENGRTPEPHCKAQHRGFRQLQRNEHALPVQKPVSRASAVACKYCYGFTILLPKCTDALFLVFSFLSVKYTSCAPVSEYRVPPFTKAFVYGRRLVNEWATNIDNKRNPSRITHRTVGTTPRKEPW